MIRLFEGVVLAEAYALSRPKTPAKIADISIAYLKKRSQPDASGKYKLMVDVGCGSGQSTAIFSHYFDKIIGIDPSSEQIFAARKQNKHQNVVFQEGTDESMPVESGSVDLVTCGQSAHWFNFPKFFKECNRVLKPAGCLVIHGYDLPKISPSGLPNSTCKMGQAAQKLIRTMYNNSTFHPRRKHVDDHYSQIYDLIHSTHKTRNDSVKIEKQGNLQDFACYLTTWSGYRSYMTTKTEELTKLHGEDNVTDSMIRDIDLLAIFLKKLQVEWKVEDVELQKVALDIIFDVFIVLSERPLQGRLE